MMRRRALLHRSVALGAAAAAPAPAHARAQPATTAPTAAPGGARKVLRLALRSPETALDPVQTQSDGNTVAVLANIFESPLAYDYLARPARLVRCTARALPEVSDDARRFVVRLRPGIFFADDPAFGGRPRELVAADYVYAIKRFFDPRWNSSDLFQFEELKLLGMAGLRRQAVESRRPLDYDQAVEGLRALDRYTFELRTAEPTPRLPWLLAASAVCGAVAREVVERYGDDIAAHPVGTGAFRLKQWRRASRIVLERNPGFRGERYEGTPADTPEAQAAAAHLAGKTLPLVDEIELSVIEEAQPRWLSFLEGSVHWLEVPQAFRPMAVPGGALAPWLVQRRVQLQRQPWPDMAMRFFNMEDPVVGGYTPERVALRRAIALGFDATAYLALLEGAGRPAESVVAPLTTGYDPAYRSEMSAHDSARAQALLDVYGYVDRNGDGWRERPDGSALVLRIASTSTLLERRINEIWQRSMSRIGVRAVFEVSTWPELLKKTRAGTVMMWGYAWTAGSPDGGFFLGLGYGPNASESNDARFRLAAYDRLYERQRALPDGPEREAAMRAAKNLLVAYMPYKVLAHTERIELVQPDVRGYWGHPFMRDVWRYVDVPRAPGSGGRQ